MGLIHFIRIFWVIPEEMARTVEGFELDIMAEFLYGLCEFAGGQIGHIVVFWSLAPSYDVNPNEKVRGLTLNISETDNALDFGLALSVAKYFRVLKDSESILKRVRRSVAKWRSIAKKYDVSASEIGAMANAFEE